MILLILMFFSVCYYPSCSNVCEGHISPHCYKTRPSAAIQDRSEYV